MRYTYLIDHGEGVTPEVGGGRQTITGEVIAVCFADQFEELERLRDFVDHLIERDVISSREEVDFYKGNSIG